MGVVGVIGQQLLCDDPTLLVTLHTDLEQSSFEFDYHYVFVSLSSATDSGTESLHILHTASHYQFLHCSARPNHIILSTVHV